MLPPAMFMWPHHRPLYIFFERCASNESTRAFHRYLQHSNHHNCALRVIPYRWEKSPGSRDEEIVVVQEGYLIGETHIEGLQRRARHA